MVQQYWQCLWSSGTGLIPSPGLWNSMMSQSDQKKILLKSLKKKKKALPGITLSSPTKAALGVTCSVDDNVLDAVLQSWPHGIISLGQFQDLDEQGAEEAASGPESATSRSWLVHWACHPGITTQSHGGL